MELTQEQKKKLVQERLDNYKVQIFLAEMNIVAFTAAGEGKKAKDIQKELEALRKAYKAVEGMI